MNMGEVCRCKFDYQCSVGPYHIEWLISYLLPLVLRKPILSQHNLKRIKINKNTRRLITKFGQ